MTFTVVIIHNEPKTLQMTFIKSSKEVLFILQIRTNNTGFHIVTSLILRCLFYISLSRELTSNAFFNLSFTLQDGLFHNTSQYSRLHWVHLKPACIIFCSFPSPDSIQRLNFLQYLPPSSPLLKTADLSEIIFEIKFSFSCWYGRDWLFVNCYCFDNWLLSKSVEFLVRQFCSSPASGGID